MSLLLWTAMMIVVSHQACQERVSAQNFVPCRGHMSKPEGSARWSWRSAWLQCRGGRSCVLLPRRASQFDPAIDKERKLISNLRRNMPVLPDSPECVALRADVDGNRLNSRFQHTHKNKLVKAHGVMEEKISYHSRWISLFRQILVNGNRMSTLISLC